MQSAAREEQELADLMMECLAIFEGGDIREDFHSSWVLFQIEEMVDSFMRIRNLVSEREESRKFFDVMGVTK
tara:strand:- start:9 stop:224 length:216 start_codon:yes stop_codon:yes gene_type:complete